MLRILIADNHAIVRRGLREILGEMPELAVIGEAGDGLEALEKAGAEQWDLILLDLFMPNLGGMQALTRLKRERSDRPVLILSFHADVKTAMRSLQAGASGYLCKDRAPEELVTAIRTVINGGTFLSRALAPGEPSSPALPSDYRVAGQ